MKTDLFQSCGHCWVFQICWHTECSTFTASSFRTWNSSTGIPSHPLALFIVMLSKAHLTSYSRMSGSRSVITPLWLSGSWRSFLYSYSVYSCHLFLISSASVRSIPFLSFYRTRICPKCSLDISNFLEEISSLLEKGEEPEIKLPISTGSSKKQESFRKTSISVHWVCQSLRLYGSQSTVENSERDGNTRPPDLPLEKPVCRLGSNS